MPKKKSTLKSPDITDESIEMSANGNELENLPPEHEDQIKIRRQKVFELWIEGYSQTEMAEKTGYAARTVARDLVELKKERAEVVKDIGKKFDINVFIGKQLRGIDRRRQSLWEDYKKSIPPQARVRISEQLSDLDVVEENLYRRLNIKTMEVKPEDLVNTNRIAVFTGAPPPGYKMPDDYVPDNPTQNDQSKKPKISS